MQTRRNSIFSTPSENDIYGKLIKNAFPTDAARAAYLLELGKREQGMDTLRKVSSMLWDKVCEITPVDDANWKLSMLYVDLANVVDNARLSASLTQAVKDIEYAKSVGFGI